MAEKTGNTGEPHEDARDASKMLADSAKEAAEKLKDAKDAAGAETKARRDATEAFGREIGKLTGAFGKHMATLIGYAQGKGGGVGGSASRMAQAAGGGPGASFAAGVAGGVVGVVASTVSMAIAKPITETMGKVVDALNPVTIAAKALNAQSSGFSVFKSAIDVLATTLGSLLLPFFVVLSAAVLSLSDMLFAKIIPGMGDFYEKVIVGGAKALEALFEDIKKFFTNLFTFITRLKGAIFGKGTHAAADATIEAATGKRPGDKQQGILPPKPDKNVDALAEKAANGAVKGRDLQKRQGNQDPQKPTTFKEGFDKGLKLVVQELRTNVGPKAQSMGIADASRSAQMAALNASPFEAKKLEMMTQILNTLGEAAEKMPGPPTTS